MPKEKLESGTYPIINDSVRKNYRHVVNGEITKGLTQSELMDKMNLPKKDRYKLSYFEQGQLDCPVSLLVKMADALDASTDLLLNRPFNAFYDHQNNCIPSIALNKVKPNAYQINEKIRGPFCFDTMFKDRPNNIKGFLLQDDCELLGLHKGDMVIVDADVKHYINTSTSRRYMCLINDSFNPKGSHRLEQCYYFSEVGIASDINGQQKKRSFYYRNPDNVLCIAGCQVLQRNAVGVVLQTIRYYI